MKSSLGKIMYEYYLENWDYETEKYQVNDPLEFIRGTDLEDEINEEDAIELLKKVLSSMFDLEYVGIATYLNSEGGDWNDDGFYTYSLCFQKSDNN